MKEYVIKNNHRGYDGRETLFKANETGVLTPKIQYSLEPNRKEQPEDAQYHLLKWKDIEKIEFGKYNGCNEYMCFYTTDGFVHILHMDIYFQSFSFDKLNKEFKKLSGNDRLNMAIVNEEVCPNYFPEEPVKKEDFLMLKRKHANDNYSPENQYSDRDFTEDKSTFSLFPKKIEYNDYNKEDKNNAITLFFILMIAVRFLKGNATLMLVCFITAIACYAYFMFFYILKKKTKFTTFKADKRGVYFYNIHDYSATLRWKNIKDITFIKYNGSLAYICFKTNDDILYFFKHPDKKSRLWYLKLVFRHYSGNKNLKIKTVKQKYPYILTDEPISENDYLAEMKKHDEFLRAQKK